MHELAVTKSLLDIVLQKKEEMNLEKILSIQLVVGKMQNYEEEWIQRYFEYVSEGTPAQGAKIQIRYLPVAFECKKCETEFEYNIKTDDKILCPSCGNKDCKLLSGREFYIESMEAV